MTAYLVTGFPGTGKTSIASQLAARGYAAHDLETMDGYMHLISRHTGHPIIAPTPVPRGWFETEGRFDWNINRLSELLASHTGTDPVFICSLADNQADHYNLFAKIFLLTGSDEILEKRLKNRGTYGAAPSELQETLELRPNFEQSLLARGAIAVDTAPSVTEVTNHILGLL